MRPRTVGKCRVEIELKARIEHQPIARHARHVNFVIAFRGKDPSVEPLLIERGLKAPTPAVK